MNFYCKLFVITIAMLMVTYSGAERACTQNADCGNGMCMNISGTTKECKCNDGYVTYNNQTCNYQQKEKLTAFLLSFLIGGTGADWFYLSQGNGGYIAAGIFKLISSTFFIFGSCVLCCAATSLREQASNKFKAFGAVCGICMIVLIVTISIGNGIWILVDWIRVLTGSFKDGNGVALKDW